MLTFYPLPVAYQYCRHHQNHQAELHHQFHVAASMLPDPIPHTTENTIFRYLPQLRGHIITLAKADPVCTTHVQYTHAQMQTDWTSSHTDRPHPSQQGNSSCMLFKLSMQRLSLHVRWWCSCSGQNVNTTRLLKQVWQRTVYLTSHFARAYLAWPTSTRQKLLGTHSKCISMVDHHVQSGNSSMCS